ncbi:MAG: non-canonical purine NTP pyrophosphatase [Microbacteriaceae bacterium]
MSSRLVLATKNAHKVRELGEILAPVLPGLVLEAFEGEEPIENGSTFAENALIKARNAMRETGLPALADDSGISVDILGGAPGIFSARWAGAKQGDRANYELLLAQLADMQDAHRAAQFVCAAALVIPDAQGGILFETAVLGVWPGQLLHAPSGEHGFGYDPVFQPEGYTVSSAMLSPEEKNSISHRHLAFEAIVPIILEHLG